MNAFSALEQSSHFLTRTHSSIPIHPIKGAFAWRSETIGCPRAHAHSLSLAEIEAVDALLDKVEASGIGIDCIRQGDWTNTIMRPLVEQCCMELFKGRGFVMLRRVPVTRWPLARAKLFMKVFGSQFGRLGLQNPQGDIIGEVRNLPSAGANARIYMTDREFRPHCDAADVLGLLAIRSAASGGQIRLTSSVSIFNALLSESPQLAKRLFEPTLLDLRNEQAEGSAPVAWITPCAHHNGVLKTLYISDYFRSADRHPGVKIDAEARSLFDEYDRLAAHPDLELRFDIEPGDLLILNNHTIVHARDAFVDTPGAERLLLRFLASHGA